MSSQELDRLAVLGRVAEKRLSQREAARVLGVTERQLRRLWQAYQRDGAAGLVSRKRGRQSNNRLPDAVRAHVVGLVRTHYADFGPTFAQEKLTELHGLPVSVSTLRTWMVAAELWVPRAERQLRVQPPRQRRECYGELIQIDGSDHRWFEDRAPPCTLLVFIDDATSTLMQLWFCESESTFSYFEAARRCLERHGKPIAFYSDKASVFRVNAKNPKAGDGYTQFGRAMGELNIETLCANTPQAKGRVERANATLQDRLVKELRLAGISTVEAANAFAEEFIESFNKRFARPARNPHNAHRPLRDDEQLQDVFIWKETRKVSRSLTLHYKRVMYVLDDTEVARSAITKQVELYESDEGEVTIWHGDRQLHARAFSKGGYVRQAAVVENKHLSAALAYAKEMQEQRTAQRLKGPSVTKREKRLMAQQQAAAEGLAPS